MFVKLKNWLQEFRLSLKMKVTLALSAIAVVLLMSSIISVLEYRRMSNYVSDMIADDIRNIHLTQKLVDAVDTYNLQLLAVIGDDHLSTLPDFDRSAFLDYCDSLRASFGAGKTGAHGRLRGICLFGLYAGLHGAGRCPGVQFHQHARLVF